VISTPNSEVLSYKPLSQKDLDPILKNRVKIWYPDRKGCEDPVQGLDYITPSKARILVMLLAELKDLGVRSDLPEDTREIFKSRTFTHLNGSRTLNFVAEKGMAPIRDRVNDNDVSVVVIDPSDDKYPTYRLIDEAMRRVVGKLLNIKTPRSPGLFVPQGMDFQTPREEDLARLGIKRNPFSALNLEHSMGGYSFEGVEDSEQENQPLEISVHSINHPEVALHFTNLDWFIPLNLFKVFEKKVSRQSKGRSALESENSESKRMSRLGSIAPGKFCLHSKEVREGEDITPYLENVRNRIITSKAALDPLATSDPNQYARIITDITDGFITLDPKVLSFFLKKGGELSGDQLGRRITWWSERKRDWIPNYNLFSLSTALMNCPSDNLLKDAFIKELSEQIQRVDLSSERLKGTWVSFFKKLIDLLPEAEGAIKDISSLPVLLRLFVPLCSHSSSLKIIDGKAQIQTKFQVDKNLLHIPVPLLSEDDSKAFSVNKRGEILGSNLGDLRFLPLSRFILVANQSVEKGHIRINETNIASQIVEAIKEGNPAKAATRMLTSRLLQLEEVAALTPFCRGEFLSPDESIFLIPALLDSCKIASKDEVENVLKFLNKELLPSIPFDFCKGPLTPGDLVFLIPKILGAACKASNEQATETLKFLNNHLLLSIDPDIKNELSLSWIKEAFESNQDTIHEWPQPLWDLFISWTKEYESTVNSKTSCVSFLFGPHKLKELAPKLLNKCIQAAESEIEKASLFFNQTFLKTLSEEEKTELCLGWVRTLFKENQKTMQKWPDAFWNLLGSMVVKSATAERPWKAFYISLVQSLPLKVSKGCAEFLLKLDKKTESWPLSGCPALIPSEESEIEFRFRSALLLRGVDSHRSFISIRTVLEKPKEKLLDALSSLKKEDFFLKNKNFLDFDVSLEKLLHEKLFDKAIKLVACQGQLFGTFNILSSFSKIYLEIGDKSKVKEPLAEALQEVLQGEGDRHEMALRAYRQVYKVPEAAAYLEDNFFDDEEKTLAFLKSKQEKLLYQEVFKFRLDEVNTMKKSKMLTSMLVGLKASKEDVSLALEKVVQRCKKEEGKFIVFEWVKEMMPSRVEDLLDLYQLKDLPFLHQCTWRLLEEESIVLKEQGWKVFLQQLESLLRNSRSKTLEAANSYLEKATGEEKAQFISACVNLPWSLQEPITPLFLKAISSDEEITPFLKECDWSTQNIQAGLDFVKRGELASPLIERLVEGVFEKIPTLSFFSLSKEMIPYFNERTKASFIQKTLELIGQPLEGVMWKERMSFLLSLDVIEVVKENGELYLETLNLALKRSPHSKWARLSNPLTIKLLELCIAPQSVIAYSEEMLENIQFARISTMIRYKNSVKVEYDLDWKEVACRIIDYLEKERFQKLSLSIIDENPSFAKLLLKELIPQLNSSLDEESVLPFLHQYIPFLSDSMGKSLARFLTKYTYEMYLRFPTEQNYEYVKAMASTSLKYDLGEDLEREELFFLEKHAEKLSTALEQKNNESIVQELANILTYKNYPHESIRPVLAKALKYTVERLGDFSFMGLLDKKETSTSGFAFFMLRSLQSFLKANPSMTMPSINRLMYLNVHRIRNMKLDEGAYELIRFLANRLLTLTEIPEHLRNQVMMPVVSGSVAAPLHMRCITEDMCKCSKELISLLVKSHEAANRELALKLMKGIHLSWVFKPQFNSSKSLVAVFQDIEAICAYLESVETSGLDETICYAIMNRVDEMKAAFSECRKVDANRTKDLLIRFMNALQSHTIEGKQDEPVFFLGVAMLEWILNPGEFDFLERLNLAEIFHPLFQAVYNARWPYNGFVILTTLYMDALQRGMEEIIPVKGLFTKSYTELLKVEKTSNPDQPLALKIFVQSVYNKCTAYYPDRQYGITQDFFMQVLDQVGRLVSPDSNYSVESVLTDCPLKERVLSEWAQWRAS
jgi:hypothetical protein